MKDPILEEVHRVREQIWEECGRDPKKLAERYRKVEEMFKDRVVSQKEWARRQAAKRRKPVAK